MKIDETQHHDVTVLALSGETDPRSFRELQEKVQSKLDEGVRRFVIDLKGISSIDRTGLRALLTLSRKTGDGGLALCSVKDRVKKSFKIAGLLPYLLITSSMRDALEQLPPSPSVSRVTKIVAKLVGANGSPETLMGGRHPQLAQAVFEILALADSRAALVMKPSTRPASLPSPSKRSSAQRSSPRPSDS